jgi:UDP:flavonoid glycosyltransferase YjiC (YdhE family)
MDEQLFWARQLQKLGLAVKPLPAKKVTAAALAKSIQSLLKSTSLQNNAKQACLILQNNDGVEEAIKLLKRHFL